jgi:hypothetical protein
MWQNDLGSKSLSDKTAQIDPSAHRQIIDRSRKGLVADPSPFGAAWCKRRKQESSSFD